MLSLMKACTFTSNSTLDDSRLRRTKTEVRSKATKNNKKQQKNKQNRKKSKKYNNNVNESV